jgi:hypothetical protein
MSIDEMIDRGYLLQGSDANTLIPAEGFDLDVEGNTVYFSSDNHHISGPTVLCSCDQAGVDVGACQDNCYVSGTSCGGSCSCIDNNTTGQSVTTPCTFGGGSLFGGGYQYAPGVTI